MVEDVIKYEHGEPLDILPTQRIRQELMKIREYQVLVQELLIKDLDYGIIPGTDKPTLLKPGAEKIAKVLGMTDQYTILEKMEDWEKMFFRYLVKCTLTKFGTEHIISEGMGECNSREAKYQFRWVYEKEIPVGIDKKSLKIKEFTSKAGTPYRKYRVDNEDLASQVNTILKMAKKRAMVDAVLSASRLSAVFTQDIEDLPPEIFGHKAQDSPKRDFDAPSPTTPLPSPPTARKKITSDQVTKLWTKATALWWNKEELHKFLDKTSSKDMLFAEAEQAIETMKGIESIVKKTQGMGWDKKALQKFMGAHVHKERTHGLNAFDVTVLLAELKKFESPLEEVGAVGEEPAGVMPPDGMNN